MNQYQRKHIWELVFCPSDLVLRLSYMEHETRASKVDKSILGIFYWWRLADGDVYKSEYTIAWHNSDPILFFVWRLLE